MKIECDERPVGKLKTHVFSHALAVLLLGAGALSAWAAGEVKIQQLATAVSDPQVITISNAVVTVFQTNASMTEDRIILRTIQNTGTNALLYAINTTNLSTTNYHGVLAGGQVARDGLGSVLDLSRVQWPVSLMTESTNGTQVAIVEMTQ